MIERTKRECREVTVQGDPNPGEEICEGIMDDDLEESFKCRNCSIYYKNNKE